MEAKQVTAKTPAKPIDGWLQIRVPSDLLPQVREAAKARGVTTSAYIRDAINRRVARDKPRLTGEQAAHDEAGAAA